jgi:cytochrome c5
MLSKATMIKIHKLTTYIGLLLALFFALEASAHLYPEYPVLEKTAEENVELIQKGEYLAKAGDCLACHTDTQNGGKPFAGGLAINTPFGTFYTPNITFDEKTGIAGWSEKDFADAMREGVNPTGGFYFPVFPYIYFSKVTDEDIHALYEYIKHVPKVERKNTPLPFPFNVPGARYSLVGWNVLFFYPDKTPFQYDVTQSEEWNRGAYLVQGLGHCSMCHTPLNPLGAPKNEYYLTGGFIDGFWAPNITRLGLESAQLQEIADVFAKDELINNAGPVEGPMAEVNHDSLKYLTNADHLAIATYLKTVVSTEPFAVPAKEKKQTSDQRGEQVYRAACIHCHLKGEVGAPMIGASHNWNLRIKDRGINTLYLHAIDGFNSMPPKGACVTCSKQDVVDAVNYLLDESLTRTQWYNLKHNK